MLPRTTPIVRWIAVVSLLVIIYFYYFKFSVFPARPIEKLPELSADLGELEYVQLLLKNNKIGPEIEYESKTIRYLPDAVERTAMTQVHESLFPASFARISIQEQTRLPAPSVMDLHVPKSPRPQDIEASSLMFGVSTTFERFHDPRLSPVKEWARWLTDGHGASNGAGLILALLNSSSSDVDTAAQQLREAGINATVLPSNPAYDMPGRYVDLVHMLYNHPTRDMRQWFVLIDDDTFFPCIHELQLQLSAFDHTAPYYIGTFTERMDWMLSNHAPFAYGGGGVFLSLPVVETINSLPCLEKKDDGSYVLSSDQGDRLLYNCIHHYTEITLTPLPRLYQLDQFEDPSGFYESGGQPLSLHHYKSWHSFSPEPAHLVADACGEACVLQRFQFDDGYILANGYSLAHYPQGINFDTAHIEHTFGAGQKENVDFEKTVFSYSFGPLRPKLSGTGRKRAWGLLGARREGDGKVKQVYLKRRGDERWLKEGEVAPDRDSVVVLNWVP